MNLRALMAVFVVSWAAWACMPLWGSAVFAALEVAVLFGIFQKVRAGRAAVRGEFAPVAEKLSPEARAFFEKYAFFYTQRQQADEWLKLLRSVGLASLLLVPVFAIHALVRAELKVLLALLPAGLFFVLNALLAPPLEVAGWVKDEGKETERGLHELVSKAIAEKNAAAVAKALAAAPAMRLAPPPSSAPPPSDPE